VRFIMKLEGRIVGPWVAECKRAWSTLESSLSTKTLALDLCGVTFVDESGLELLREIYRATHAEIVSNSPLTKHFAEQAMQSTTDGRQGV
jgi:ABC-type transporter Mla MlaB component